MRFRLVAVIAVLLVGMLPSSAASAQAGETIRLELTSITPSTVDGPTGDVTVTGRLTNTSGSAISNLEARIQRGNPITTEPAARQALHGTVPTGTQPAFTPIATRVAPGEQIAFQLRIPLSGPQSLQISNAGVYPVLVNVNGVPEAGNRARVGQAQFLLPVTGPDTRPAQPTPTSMIVPLVDYPKLEREPSTGLPALLTDDQLAASIAPGGRLYGLVQAVSDSAPSGSPMGSALCFAIDPDLLVTVNVMRGRYLVEQQNGPPQEGIGSNAADLWLNKLKDVTRGRCVIALPYSDADIAALGRAGLPDLIKGALDGTQLVRDTLGVEPRSVVWPIDGALDQQAADALDKLNIQTVLMQPEALSIPQGTLSPVKLHDRRMTAIPIDPLLSSALDPLHDTPSRVTVLSPEDSTLSAENTLGALLFRATQGSVPDSLSVLAPPRRWNMRGDDLRTMLAGIQQLAAAGYVKLTALPQPDSNKPAEAAVTYPVTSRNAEIPESVLRTLARENFQVGDLFRSSRREQSIGVDPGQVTTPLRNGLLHGASSAWRANLTAAQEWVGRGTQTVQTILSQVWLEEFTGRITLAASNSSIPLTVRNNLPITVQVVFRTPRTPGIEIKDLGVVRVPANGSRPFWLQTSAQRAGQFTMDISVTTEAGTQFGPTKRIRVESNAYPPFTLILTIVAGALLVILSLVRITRRIKAARRRAALPDIPDAPLDAKPQRPDVARVTTTEGDRNPS